MAENKNKKYVSDDARLMSEWNWDKNGELIPTMIMLYSNKKIWWICEKGHEWQAKVEDRTNGSGCPYCANKKVLKGYNDLNTINPSLAKEWNYSKNNDKRPEQYTASSRQKVWWICEKGHEWQATICDRNNGHGCPICSSERNTSFQEFAIIYYLEKYNIKTRHSYNEHGYELDIYIPTKNIAVEYDGYFWHKDKIDKDLEKNKKCKRDNILLYRIREGLPSLNDTSLDFCVQKSQKDLDKRIEEVLTRIVGDAVDVDLQRDFIAIEDLREHIEKNDSLLHQNPRLAKEWNYEKNGNLKPEHVTINSDKKVWWICEKGHEWQAVVKNRNHGSSCPYCSKNRILKGYNDLQTINPKLTKEWNYEKNGYIKPFDVMPNSNKKVWWICEKGHEWQALISSRNRGSGCPYCAGKKVIKGFNDLKTTNPELAKEWNYKRNIDKTPDNFTACSGQKVWWICEKGHEWQATINNRNNGSGCPYCAGRKK